MMGIKERRFDSATPRHLAGEISSRKTTSTDGSKRALDLSFVRDLVRRLYARGGGPSRGPGGLLQAAAGHVLRGHP